MTYPVIILPSRTLKARLLCYTALSRQRLTHGGREIEDDKVLADYGVKPNSTLYLVLKLPGGYVHPVGSLPTGIDDVSESLF